MTAPITAIIITLIGFPTVDVYTDGNPAHWRAWPVRSHSVPLSTELRCQSRVDASRVLRGKPVTTGLPFKCMTSTTRNRHPDIYRK